MSKLHCTKKKIEVPILETRVGTMISDDQIAYSNTELTPHSIILFPLSLICFSLKQELKVETGSRSREQSLSQDFIVTHQISDGPLHTSMVEQILPWARREF